MELLQLRYFFESAQNENFTKTAKKYMVPTSSVSASVRRLETELGCKLFDRSSTRIILNNNGKRLRQSLYSVFAELDGAFEDLSVPDADNREIKILVRAMRSAITDYIIEYSKKYSHIAFQTVFDFGETELEKYDIIIDEKRDNLPDYESFELFNMNIRMKVSSNSLLLKEKLRLKQLQDRPFVSMGENSNMQRILNNACKRAGFMPHIVAQINDIRCYEKLIASGIGIGLGRENSEDRGISYLDVSDFDERYVVHAYFKSQNNYGNVMKFLEFLKKRAQTQM